MHVKSLLLKLDESPLSPAERLEIKGICELFAARINTVDYSFEELRELNDAFSRILKLSAKYAV